MKQRGQLETMQWQRGNQKVLKFTLPRAPRAVMSQYHVMLCCHFRLLPGGWGTLTAVTLHARSLQREMDGVPKASTSLPSGENLGWKLLGRA